MSAEAAGGDLAVEIEDGHLPVGLGPASRQVGLEWVELAGELTLSALDHVLPAGGAGVSLDGVPSPAQVAGDVADAHALGEKVVDQCVVSARPLGEPAGRIRPFIPLVGCRCGGCLPLGLRLRAGRWQVAQARTVGGDGLLHRGGQVLPEVEAVGDLDGLRCGCGGSIGVGAGAVAADDLDAGMGLQPRGQGGGVAFGQQVEDLVGLGVDHDGSVDVAATHGEIVHTDRPGFRGGRIGHLHHAAQERSAAGGDPHELGEAGTGPAGQGQTDRAHRLPQPFGDPAVAASQPWHLLHERPSAACRGRAQEPAHPQREFRSSSGRG
ncbi:hypothetical protein QFZ43_000032 [Streptomyces afghaniensis]|nr:hypothetical protein [Streptomyces afghaniensis]